jgi:hypothetical protein
MSLVLIYVAPRIISHPEDALKRFALLLQLLSKAIVDRALMAAPNSITTSRGLCALIGPLILTRYRALFVLIYLLGTIYIQLCAQWVLCCG